MTDHHHAPHDCPVCGDHLAITRLGCASCGSEIGGQFATCEFCALDVGELETLRVFLASRGNLRELEKHLGVSYPTARLRLTQLLMKLGLSGDAGEPGSPGAEGSQAEVGDDRPDGPSRDEVLAGVANGTIDPGEAQRLLGGR